MNKNSPDPSCLVDQAEHWVVRLASGAITPKEMATFEVWLAASPDHRTAFDRERSLWHSLESQEAAFASAPPAPRASGRRDHQRAVHGCDAIPSERRLARLLRHWC